MVKNWIIWIVLIGLMFVPMFVTFAFSDTLISAFQDEWNYRSGNYILSNLLFYEAGFFLVFGAMLAGAVLFTAWKPDRLALFVDSIFRVTIIKKERDIPSALLLGLLIIGIGIIYIFASITITL